MKHKNPPLTDPSTAPLTLPILRQQAEAIARQQAAQSLAKLEALTPETIQAMLHDLQVHQIQLELQNEELRLTQIALDESKAHYFDLYDLAPVGYCTLSESALILNANLTMANLLGVARGALPTQPLSRFIIREDQDHYYRLRTRLLGNPAAGSASAKSASARRAGAGPDARAEESASCELRMVRGDGTPFWALLGATVARTELNGQEGAGDALALRLTLTDISVLKEHQNQLQRMAHFDALTKLPNRLLLADRLHQGLIHAARRGRTLAVAYLDLDGFKAINDRHGHDVGDQLLIALAANMRHVLREGDTLARMGGDEFVAVLTDLTDPQASVHLLTRLLAGAAQEMQVGERTLRVSASLGVTFYPQAQDIEPDQLLRQADQAMYQAKVAGKNRYHVFDATHDNSLRAHHESLERIRVALSAHEFVLYYQPKVNMRTGEVIGAEALIRWQHPEKGLLAPAVFLPVIEDDPVAVTIGEWVIDTALTQMVLWRAAGLDIPVSVNIGARQLQQADFVDRLRAILAAHPRMSSSCLELEVLETSALADIAQVSQVIEACAQIGVNFALDDFGTGYSSLTYLKRLRVTLLKIDQSFVHNMLDDPDDLTILQGVIGLAAAFKRQVIAEGVESAAHGAMLLQLGCELAQGYGIARPMPSDQLPRWSRTWKPEPSWSGLPSLDAVN